MPTHATQDAYQQARGNLATIFGECLRHQDFQKAWDKRMKEHLDLSLEVLLGATRTLSSVGVPTTLWESHERYFNCKSENKTLILVAGYSPEQVVLSIGFHFVRFGCKHVRLVTTKDVMDNLEYDENETFSDYYKTMRDLLKMKWMIEVPTWENFMNPKGGAVEVQSDSANSIFKEIRGLIGKTEEWPNYAIDATGGTKPMDSGASVCAAYFDLPAYYIHACEYNPHLRRPLPQSAEYILVDRPTVAFSRGRRESIANACAARHFSLARELLTELREEIVEVYKDFFDKTDDAAQCDQLIDVVDNSRSWMTRGYRKNAKDRAEIENELVKPRIEGCDLRLMSSVEDLGSIPTEGKYLIVVADVNHMLHFRTFDGDGKMVEDTDEQKLTEHTRQIGDLRKQLEKLWPPHELTTRQKARVITDVASLAGHTLDKDARAMLVRLRRESRNEGKWKVLMGYYVSEYYRLRTLLNPGIHDDLNPLTPIARPQESDDTEQHENVREVITIGYGLAESIIDSMTYLPICTHGISFTQINTFIVSELAKFESHDPQLLERLSWQTPETACIHSNYDRKIDLLFGKTTFSNVCLPLAKQKPNDAIRNNLPDINAIMDKCERLPALNAMLEPLLDRTYTLNFELRWPHADSKSHDPAKVFTGFEREKGGVDLEDFTKSFGMPKSDNWSRARNAITHLRAPVDKLMDKLAVQVISEFLPKWIELYYRIARAPLPGNPGGNDGDKDPVTVPINLCQAGTPDWLTWPRDDEWKPANIVPWCQVGEDLSRFAHKKLCLPVNP